MAAENPFEAPVNPLGTQAKQRKVSRTCGVGFRSELIPRCCLYGCILAATLTLVCLFVHVSRSIMLPDPSVFVFVSTVLILPYVISAAVAYSLKNGAVAIVYSLLVSAVCGLRIILAVGVTFVAFDCDV